MKNKLLFSFTLILFGSLSFGQNNDSLLKIDLKIISQVNQGNSYITFPTDIGNIEKLWFEGNVIPNFYIRTNKNSRLMGVLTPQIIIRMFQEYSFPVKTPSYIPQVTMYYKINSENRDNTVFARLAHHSNGQSGNFFLDNGNINLESGDFSTQYFELGLIRSFFNTHFNANQFFRTSFERHYFEDGSFQYGIYSRFRLKSSFSVFKIRQENSVSPEKKAGFSFRLDSEWMFGDIYTWNENYSDRLNIGLKFFYSPTFFEDIGFFFELYHGQDYYNIYFDHQLNIIRFGIMTEKLRF